MATSASSLGILLVLRPLFSLRNAFLQALLCLLLLLNAHRVLVFLFSLLQKFCTRFLLSLLLRNVLYFGGAIATSPVLSAATAAATRSVSTVPAISASILTQALSAMAPHISLSVASEVPATAIVSSVPVLPKVSFSAPIASAFMPVSTDPIVVR